MVGKDLTIYQVISDEHESDLVNKLNQRLIRPLGQVRLWIDSKPPVRTNKIILVTEVEVDAVGDLVKSVDLSLITSKVDEILTRCNRNFTDYGASKRKTFHFDIVLPKAVIDGYTG